MQPLADRMRPKTLDEVAGQRHLIGEGGVLRAVLEAGAIPNMVFYGPPGIGKTTVADILARAAGRTLVRLNATVAGTADIRDAVDQVGTMMAPDGVLLYIDEIQYFNKKQQQTLLESTENGKVTLISSTTENPYFYVYPAILSRSTVFEFKPLTPEDVLPVVKRAFDFVAAESGIPVTREVGVDEFIAASCGGDVRKAVNAVELITLTAKGAVTMELAAAVVQKSAVRYDRDGDSHFDVMSAFQKSLRGSDPDAALHYLARLLEGGDLPSACRRLLVTAAEDVGLAYPMALPVVKAACDAARELGLPEARIVLAEAVILVATSPKSNSAICGIDAAMEDLRQGGGGEIPAHLRDTHYEGAKNLGRGLTYQYPHAFENSWTPQQYLPDALKDRVYYTPGDNKTEQAAAEYWKKIKGGKS
ncbi:MAG TPA: replication-associated recombination protein A [Candidatus Acidoferrum sp.]|nr:replication-associated recombination protein A [Candidatus Acidoferrum sp.]